MNIAIVDTSNLSFRLKRLFPYRILDYTRLKEQIDSVLGRPADRLVAFGTDFENRAHPFRRRLECLGYLTKFKPVLVIGGKPITTNCDVEIVIEALQFDYDEVLIVTGGFNMKPLVAHLREQNVKIFVMGFDVVRTYNSIANRAIELNEEMLLDPTDKA